MSLFELIFISANTGQTSSAWAGTKVAITNAKPKKNYYFYDDNGSGAHAFGGGFRARLLEEILH